MWWRTVTRGVSQAVSTCDAGITFGAKPYAEVPGPRPLPLLGNTWRFFPLVGHYELADVAKISQDLYETYGRIVKLSGLIGRPDLLFVFDADQAEKVYRAEGDTPLRPAMPCIVKYKTDVRKDFFGDLPGVIGVHGEPWRVFRTKVQKPILQPKVVKKYIAPIEDVTNEFIQRMLEMKDANEEMPDDFDNEIHKWSLECIGRIALDVRLGCLDKDLPPDSEPQKIIDAAKFALRKIAILELKAPYWRYFPTTAWKDYVKNMDFFRYVCMKYIKMAIKNMNAKNIKSKEDLSLLERILETQKDAKLASILALDLIMVGIDTDGVIQTIALIDYYSKALGYKIFSVFPSGAYTGRTISMAVCSILYQLSIRQAEQQKMHEELVRIIPDPNANLTAEMLDSMVYLKSFIREVLRMYSTVIGNGRVLQEDMTICGYHIPKGIQLVFPSIVMGSLPEYVSNPTTFKPERWMKEHESDEYVHPFASLPYGYGARMCLGRRFADIEMQILLAKLIREYKLEFFHDPLEYKVSFMYAPHGNLKLKVTKWTN